MNIKFIGLKENEKHLQFEYRVTIGKESTSYFTGIGWCKAKAEKGLSVFHVPREHAAAFARVFKPFGSLALDDLPSMVYRRPPSPSDIAECLLSDIDFGKQSFDEFCDNLGLSNDSLKALDTYRACMDMARKFKRADLIKHLTAEQKEQLGIEE